MNITSHHCRRQALLLNCQVKHDFSLVAVIGEAGTTKQFEIQIMTNYIPVLIFLMIVFALTGAMLAMIFFIGPKRNNPHKQMPFETGNLPTAPGDARERYPVHFFLVAILFVVFDIEIAFMYPWAVQFKQLGLVGLVEMIIFVTILMFGWYYIIKRGVLGWK